MSIQGLSGVGKDVQLDMKFPALISILIKLYYPPIIPMLDTAAVRQCLPGMSVIHDPPDTCHRIVVAARGGPAVPEFGVGQLTLGEQ